MQSYKAKYVSAGFGSISSITALALIASTLTMLLCVLQQSVKTDVKTRLVATNTYSELRSLHLFETVLDDLDTYTFEILPRIHKSANITFTDGSSNQVLSSQTTLRPLAGSDAISAIRLQSSHDFLVSACEQQGTSLKIEACLRHQSSFSNEGLHGFLGLALTAAYDFQGTLSGSGKCRNFNLVAQKSMLVPVTQNSIPCAVHILVPIEALYTLYLDSNAQLRYLSHEGANNIENQPLVNSINSIELESDNLFGGAIFLLSLNLELANHRQVKRTLYNQLSRKPLANFLLNP